MLYQIPSDPVPTEEELKPYLDAVKSQKMLRPPKWMSLERYYVYCARGLWREDVKLRNPNAFHVREPPPNYEAYLGKRKWLRDIRKRALARFNGQCACCETEAFEVHHRDYRDNVMSGENIEPLVALCGRCHRLVHWDGQLRRSWDEQEQVLEKLVRAKCLRVLIEEQEEDDRKDKAASSDDTGLGRRVQRWHSLTVHMVPLDDGPSR